MINALAEILSHHLWPQCKPLVSLSNIVISVSPSPYHTHKVFFVVVVAYEVIYPLLLSHSLLIKLAHMTSFRNSGG